MTQEMEGVREYILKEFLPDESPDELTETTPLITGGIIESIGALKLIDFLEDHFGIEIEAHEVSEENLDSLSKIMNLIHSKL